MQVRAAYRSGGFFRFDVKQESGEFVNKGSHGKPSDYGKPLSYQPCINLGYTPRYGELVFVYDGDNAYPAFFKSTVSPDKVIVFTRKDEEVRRDCLYVSFVTELAGGLTDCLKREYLYDVPDVVQLAHALGGVDLTFADLIDYLTADVDQLKGTAVALALGASLPDGAQILPLLLDGCIVMQRSSNHDDFLERLKSLDARSFRAFYQRAAADLFLDVKTNRTDAMAQLTEVCNDSDALETLVKRLP